MRAPEHHPVIRETRPIQTIDKWPNTTLTLAHTHNHTYHIWCTVLLFFLTNKDFVYALNYKLEVTAEHQETIGHRKPNFLFDAKMISIEK